MCLKQVILVGKKETGQNRNQETKTTSIKHYINRMLVRLCNENTRRKNIYCEKDWNGNGKRYLLENKVS